MALQGVVAEECLVSVYKAMQRQRYKTNTPRQYFEALELKGKNLKRPSTPMHKGRRDRLLLTLILRLVRGRITPRPLELIDRGFAEVDASC